MFFLRVWTSGGIPGKSRGGDFRWPEWLAQFGMKFWLPVVNPGDQAGPKYMGGGGGSGKTLSQSKVPRAWRKRYSTYATLVQIKSAAQLWKRTFFVILYKFSEIIYWTWDRWKNKAESLQSAFEANFMKFSVYLQMAVTLRSFTGLGWTEYLHFHISIGLEVLKFAEGFPPDPLPLWYRTQDRCARQYRESETDNWEKTITKTDGETLQKY